MKKAKKKGSRKAIPGKVSKVRPKPNASESENASIKSPKGRGNSSKAGKSSDQTGANLLKPARGRPKKKFAMTEREQNDDATGQICSSYNSNLDP